MEMIFSTHSKHSNADHDDRLYLSWNQRHAPDRTHTAMALDDLAQRGRISSLSQGSWYEGGRFQNGQRGCSFLMFRKYPPQQEIQFHSQISEANTNQATSPTAHCEPQRQHVRRASLNRAAMARFFAFRLTRSKCLQNHSWPSILAMSFQAKQRSVCNE